MQHFSFTFVVPRSQILLEYMGIPEAISAQVKSQICFIFVIKCLNLLVLCTLLLGTVELISNKNDLELLFLYIKNRGARKCKFPFDGQSR